jgi:hypothetical protein
MAFSGRGMSNGTAWTRLSHRRLGRTYAIGQGEKVQGCNAGCSRSVEAMAALTCVQ